MKGRHLALIGALICGSAVLSPLWAEDLLSLYSEARNKSATYLAAQAAFEADREVEPQALGQLLPNIGVNGNFSRNRTDRWVGRFPADRFEYDSYSYGIAVRQPIYRKYNFALYEQSKAQVRAAESRLDQAGMDLAVKLASAYMDALFADDQERLVRAQKASLAGQLAAAEKAFAAGAGTRVDIDEAQARYDMVLAQEIEVRNQQLNARRSLASFVNREVETISPLDIKKLDVRLPTPSDPLAWLREAEASNAQYREAQALALAGEQEVEKALAGHYPTLDLVANRGRSGNDSVTTLNRAGDTRYDLASVGVQMNLPLFAGGQVSAAARQARAKLEQLRQQAEDIRRNLAVEVRKEYGNVEQGLGKIRALERAEASGRQMVYSTKRGVEGGVRSTLDVLQVEQQYYTVLRDLAQARYNYLLAGLRLKALAGRLSFDDIENVNSSLANPAKELLQ